MQYYYIHYHTLYTGYTGSTCNGVMHTMQWCNTYHLQDTCIPWYWGCHDIRGSRKVTIWYHTLKHQDPGITRYHDIGVSMESGFRGCCILCITNWEVGTIGTIWYYHYYTIPLYMHPSIKGDRGYRGIGVYGCMHTSLLRHTVYHYCIPCILRDVGLKRWRRGGGVNRMKAWSLIPKTSCYVLVLVNSFLLHDDQEY